MYRLGLESTKLVAVTLLALGVSCGGSPPGVDQGGDAGDDRRVPIGRGETIRIAAPASLPTEGFGATVALAGDRLAVAEFLEQDQARVWVYRLVQDEVRPLALLHPQGLERCFGRSLAVWESTVAVGAPCAGGGAGVVHVYQLGPGGPVEVATLLPDPADGLAGFGSSVAMQGNLLVVGAPFAASRAGGAFTFTRAAGAWTPEGRLTPSDLQVGDAYGWAVSLRDEMLAVTAPGRYAGTVGASGLVHVFERENGAWEEELDDLVPVHVDIAEGTARAVTVGPGVVVMTGDSYVTHSVHAFELGAVGWFEEEVDPELRGVTTDTGFAHALAMDGDLLVVGMPTMVGPYGQYRAGGAWVYRHTASGWLRLATVDGTAAWDKAGHAVAVARGVVAVGIPGEYSYPYNSGSGSVVLMRP